MLLRAPEGTPGINGADVLKLPFPRFSGKTRPVMHKQPCCPISLLGLLTAVFLAAVAGCSKSDPKEKAAELGASTPDAGRTVARLHWLGRQRLAAEGNATNFMAIWNLPESAKLEAQTLDKLSTAPWRLLSVGTPLANAPTALLRPLLDDLVKEESYLEVQATTNQPTSLDFAIRLDAARAALWRANLPVVLKSLIDNRSISSPAGAPSAGDLDFRLQTSDFEFVMSRAGEWTILSFTDLRHQTLDLKLLEPFRSRIAATQTPYPPRTTNYWLETDADLRAFAGWIPFQSVFRPSPSGLKNLPRITMTLIGDGQNVRTRGELSFSNPIPIELEPWNIPTNLVHDPLIGFMGVRGIRPCLEALKFWNKDQLGQPPNQAFYWVQDGMPAFRFFALPSAQASNQVHHFSEFLINDVGPHFASSSPTNGVRYGAFERLPDSPQLRWRGIPFIAPSVGLTETGGNPFVTGGLFRNTLTNQSMPGELLRQFQSDTNLVFYDWETTQTCESSLIQLTQLGRLVFGRARLSITNNPALPWLVAISPKLGITGTAIRLADANRLTFSRSSTLGLSGVELHLLADWLESPTFPKSFFTLEAKPTPLMTSPATARPTNKTQ